LVATVGAWLAAAGLARAEQAPPEASPAGAAPEVTIMPVPPAEPDRLRVSGEAYLWLASLTSSVAFPVRGDTVSADVDLSAGDVLQSLNFAAMGDFEVRYGPVALFNDLIYVDLSASGSRVRPLTGPLGRRQVPVDLGSKVRIKEFIWTAVAGYDAFRDERNYLQVFGGFRYVGVNSRLTWSFALPVRDIGASGTATTHADIIDVVGGVRGESALGASRWKLVYYADVGGGDSERTWQAEGKIAYAWSWGDVAVGYRHLEYKPGGGSALQDLKMSGPILSAKYRF
jgi:hypothetical protein